MIVIEVEGLDKLFDYPAFEQEFNDSIPRMAQDTNDFWQSIAGKRLKSSRIKYQSSIKIDSITKDSFDIDLDGGFLPWAVEVGTGPYPMQVQKGQIVPLNVNRQIIFTSPQVWRTGIGEPWRHPGFPGFNMRNDVVDELVNEIFPRYLDEMMRKL